MVPFANPDNPIIWIAVLIAITWLITPGLKRLAKEKSENKIIIIGIWIVGLMIMALMFIPIGYIVMKLST